MKVVAGIRGEGQATTKVLDGVRVLDLGSFITAPYAAMLLAEIGADVLKVEKPGVGDPFRSFKGGSYSPHFQGHNRNKRSIALDFTKPAGREVLDQLVAKADVVLINVRPGAEERMGVSAARLQTLNPRLVYCAITGFGATGPNAARPAYDNVGQAASGWLSMFHDGDDARVPGPAVSDALTGLYAAFGILGALMERERTGKGRKVEVSMLEATMAFATEPLAQYFATGEALSFYSRASASQSYVVTCKDGKRIGLHLSSPDKFWQGLGQAIGREDLLTKYPDRMARVEHYDELAKALSETFATRERDHWLPLLEQNDVPFAPERRLEELADDPQVQHLDLFYSIAHPLFGTVKAMHRPIRYDGDNRSDYAPPPALGEHTDAVLASLGVTPERIEELRAAAIVG